MKIKFDELKKFLSSDFEKKLLIEVENNLNSKSKIRFSNFAYAMRELIDIVLLRLAPNNNVKQCCWYEVPEIADGRDVSREQRIKYAIQGSLSDTILEIIDLEIDEDIKSMNKYISKVLSKYTHISEKLFNLNQSEVMQNAYDFDRKIRVFIKKTEEVVNLIEGKFEELINDTMINEIVSMENEIVLNELDILSTHSTIDDISDVCLKINNMSSHIISYTIHGNICVQLQYGSDGDVKRGDGSTGYITFPFTIDGECNIPEEFKQNMRISQKKFISSLSNALYESLNNHINVNVDTSKFYE